MWDADTECLKAAVRAAHDFGYYVICFMMHAPAAISGSATHGAGRRCACRNIATLKSYAQVISVGEWTQR